MAVNPFYFSNWQLVSKLAEICFSVCVLWPVVWFLSAIDQHLRSAFWRDVKTKDIHAVPF